MLRWMLPKHAAPALLHSPRRPRRARAGQRPTAALQRLSSAPLGLDAVATGLSCRVVSVTAPADQSDWAGRLAEIGFIPGEAVCVQARSAWGGDPMVVRIAESTFALRLAEAACVQVQVQVQPLADPA